MKRLRLFWIVLFSSTLLLSLAPTAKADVDLYITPGYHTVNGRQWHTDCVPYSQTSRCTTQIWATKVTYEDGRYVQRNGWVFNNLTYKASPRLLWVTNPLWTATGAPPHPPAALSSGSG